ncbi:MAG: hypothetical protein JNL58_08110 [Planctomyces sp.]|nr:hypothetical protein [Planctomyces sp.]
MNVRIYNPPLDRFAQLREDVLQDMSIEALPKGRESRRERRRREKVERTIEEFRCEMEGSDPPRSEEELLTRLTPITSFLISWLIRQIVIEVLKACWRRWNGSENSQGCPQ